MACGGGQPDDSEVDAVSYLMRTTAVYGAGKFGVADRHVIENRLELNGPFSGQDADGLADPAVQR